MYPTTKKSIITDTITIDQQEARIPLLTPQTLASKDIVTDNTTIDQHGIITGTTTIGYPYW